eukprot:GEMP01044188.1.p1 GENE.GEMP01044188.1~~GEMP01044188.1.p1  ORF type:complete len:349 (+),score=44.01 GEMP01044188.1:353-1399(+)
MLQGATDARLSYSPTSRQLISPVPVPAPTYPPTPIAGSNRPGIVRNMHRELQLVPRGLHVQHAFNETQLKTLLGNLNMGANALRSLNKRVEMVGKLSPQIQRFNYKMSRNSEKVARALKSGKRTVAGRVETSSRTLRAARNTTLENFTELSERLGEMDIGEGAGSFARTLRPYIASVVVLILELLVFQTYLGILTATYIKEVPRLYKRYFLASGVAVFVVFALSIFWLFVTQFQLRKNERLKRQQRQQSEEQSLSPKHEFSNIRHSSFQGRFVIRDDINQKYRDTRLPGQIAARPASYLRLSSQYRAHQFPPVDSPRTTEASRSRQAFIARILVTAQSASKVFVYEAR